MQGSFQHQVNKEQLMGASWHKTRLVQICHALEIVTESYLVSLCDRCTEDAGTPRNVHTK
eukprot:3274274-Amphidinium_carterae.2